MVFEKFTFCVIASRVWRRWICAWQKREMKMNFDQTTKKLFAQIILLDATEMLKRPWKSENMETMTTSMQKIVLFRLS